MPAPFALGQHAALVAAKEKLNDEDCLFAFLDDLYAITNKERANLFLTLSPKKLKRLQEFVQIWENFSSIVREEVRPREASKRCRP